MYTLALVLCIAASAYAAEIDNRLTGEPIVDCQDTMVSLTFNTEKPFAGRIYVKGLADDDRCSRNFAANNDQSKFSMMINQGDCNMGRQRVFGSGQPLEGLVFSLVIVVSFHGTFVTKADRAFRCMCFFRNIKRVTNLLDMSMIGTTELLDTVKTPTCTYEIRSGSPTGPLVRYAKIGDKIYHTWSCDDPEQGFLVHSCMVNDGRGNVFDLLDIDGCAIDPIIQPDISYSENLDLAHVETHGYKFSDTSVLDYMCVLELCKKAAGECNGFVPPTCGRGKRRRRNAVVVSPGDEIDPARIGSEMDVASTLQILDTLDEDAEVSGPDAKLMKELNQHAFASRPNGTPYYQAPIQNESQMCLSVPAFTFMIALTVILIVAATVSGAILCSRSSSKSL
jgi:hypothetical protein